jgi:hypothetical protein
MSESVLYLTPLRLHYLHIHCMHSILDLVKAVISEPERRPKMMHLTAMTGGGGGGGGVYGNPLIQ